VSSQFEISVSVIANSYESKRKADLRQAGQLRWLVSAKVHYIEILEINKTKMAKPMQLIFSIWQWGNLSNTKLPLNQILSLRVYETGGMEGIPQNAMKETSYVSSVGWGFRTSVVILYEER
jgi:hypothetical protein